MVELWSHQKRAIDDNHPYRGFFVFAGGGKSLILKELVRNNAFSVLCLTPKSLKLKWEREIEEIPNIEKTVMTPYYFKRDWKKLPYYDAIIIDEGDSPWAGKNQSSKALFCYLKKHNPAYLWVATATPYRSTPLNVYNLGKLCRYCPMTYPQFREQFFFQEYFGAQAVWTPKLKHPSAYVKAQTQAELNEYMANFADIVQMEDVFDMPEIIYSVDPIEPTKEQERMLKKVDLLSENRATFFRYANEIENGYLDQKAIGKQADIAENKTERVLELCEQNDTLVIFSYYRDQQAKLLKAITKKFPKAFVALLNGDNSDQAPILSEELERIAKGQHPDYETGYLIASPQVSAGWEVESCTMGVYVSLPWSYQAWIQSQGRILRSSNLKKTVYKILEGGAVDARIWKNLESGQDYDPAKHSW